MATPNSPSFKGFQLTDFLMKIILWRNDISLFFLDITHLIPRPFQVEFFQEVQDLHSHNIVIVAGRGIGKTLALAVVALWYVLVMSISENRPFKVVILAGSLDQAKICFTYVMDFVNNSAFLQKHLGKEPTQREIMFKDGSWIRPLPASEKSIRGHHPDLLIIDEAAEVDEDVIYSALPMTAPSPYARQIFSSTPSEGFSWIENKWEHQLEYPYPDWKFFNWNAESFLPKEQVELLKRMLPANEYCVEIQGLPYKREGKVFRLEDLKECQEKPVTNEEPKEELGETYAGVDWGYCLMGETEVLTKFGWKRMDELIGRELILTWNKRRNILEFQEPISYHKTYSERICEIWKNKNLSLIGTWHHAIPCFDRSKKRFHEHELGQNLSHHYLIRRAKCPGFRPKEIMGFKARDFMRLLGWYLSEGSTEFSSRGYRVSIAQTDLKNRKKIKDLLLRMHLDPHDHENAIRFSNRNLAQYLFALGGSCNKYIPKDIKNLDPSLLKLMFRTMMLGDGDKDGIRYNTYSPQLADDFQEICIRIGEKLSYIEKRKKEKGFRIHLLSRDSSPNSENHSQKTVSGYFVALEVPNQYVLIRHEGMPLIIHNYPAPTVLIVVKKIGELWKVLYSESFLAQNFEEVHKKIKATCESYNVITIYTDSTDKGENLRLAGMALPVVPIAFKGEKAAMISNLRMLVEQHRLRFDPLTQQRLIGQMLDYIYDSKRNDDFVDCFDPITEVLTKNGWKKISEVSFEDDIATMKDSYLTYEKPVELIEEDFEGKAIKLSGREIDLLITPRHKLYVALSTGAGTYDSFKLVRAKDLLGKHFRVKKTVKWEGKEEKYHVIPGLRGQSLNIRLKKEKLIPMMLWSKFLGYYLSEGNTTLNKVSIAQKDGPKKAIIRETMKELPFKIKETPNDLYIYSKQLAEHLRPLGKSHDKFIPQDILELSSKYLSSLLDSLMLGDGCRNHYYTTSKKLADNVQELCLKIGLSAEVRILREKNIGFIRGRRINGGRIYTVDIHLKGEPRVNHHPRKLNTSTIYEVPYSGKMYCLTIPSHIIYVRRNGHPQWSGNSLMLAVKANPLSSTSSFDLEALLKEVVGRKKGYISGDKERKRQIGNKLREIGRI